MSFQLNLRSPGQVIAALVCIAGIVYVCSYVLASFDLYSDQIDSTDSDLVAHEDSSFVRRSSRDSKRDEGISGIDNSADALSPQRNTRLKDETRWRVKSRLLRQDQTVISDQMVSVEEQPSPEHVMSISSAEEKPKIQNYEIHTSADGGTEFPLIVQRTDHDAARIIVFELKNETGIAIARARVPWPSTTNDGVADLGDVYLINVNARLEVRARILDHVGKARSNCRVKIFERVNGQSRNAAETRHSVETDNEGNLKIELLTPFARHEDHVVLDFSADGFASVQLPSDRTHRAIDLGEVFLSKLESVVEGRIIDNEGKGVPNVHLMLYKRINDEWTHDVDQQFGSDANGRFNIISDFESAEFKLGAQKYGYETVLTPVILKGSQGVEIKMTNGGLISGQVRVDAGVPTNSIVLHLNCKPRRMNMVPDAEGNFTCSFGVPPGKYTLTCDVPGSEPLIFREIEVRAGETLKDPRINPVDLRGKLKALRFRCLEESGRPCRKKAVRLVDSKHESLLRPSWTDRNGYVAFGIPSSRFEGRKISAAIMGYGTRELKWPTESTQDVVFRKLVKVSATIAGHSSYNLRYPLKLSLRNSTGSGAGGWAREGLCTLLIEPGQYTVGLAIGTVKVPFKGPSTVNIPRQDAGAAVRVSLVVDPNDLTRARQEYASSLNHKKNAK